MIDYSDIRQVHLEISTRCNAACPGCPRNLRGVDVRDDYPLHDMSLSEAQAIFTPAFLKQLNHILINGNLGDFVTAQDGLEIVRYFREQNENLNITISTNGGARPGMWKELGKLGVLVYFCIDGLEGTHSLYRQQTKWETVVNNAREFISAGGQAIWKTILFDHNRHQIEECRRLSQELGFKNFISIDHGRNSFAVFNQKKQFTHDIGTHEDPKDWNELYNNFQQFVNYSCLKEYDFEPADRIDCKAKKEKSIYIAANGEVYPCCWTGFYPKKMAHNGNTEIKKLINCNNNANKVGVEQAITWFDEVASSWTDGRQTFACSSNCSSCITK